MGSPSPARKRIRIKSSPPDAPVSQNVDRVPGWRREGKVLQSRAAKALPGDVFFFSSPQLACFDTEPVADVPVAASWAVCGSRADFLLTNARESSTRTSYCAFWVAFVHFIIMLAIPNEVVSADFVVRLPVAVDTVFHWVGFLSWHYAPTTLDIAMAAIGLVHEHANFANPAAAGKIRMAIEGAARIFRGPRNTKWLLLPQHVTAILSLDSIRCGADCTGRPWSDQRIMRIKVAACIGFIAFLRKCELLALDVCDVLLAISGAGHDIIVRKAKNDPQGRGRSSVVGNTTADGTGVFDLIRTWVATVVPLGRGICSKSRDSKSHCTACGWFFPKLGGRPARVVRDVSLRPKSTTNFLTADLRQAIRQLQIDRHPDVDPALNVLSLSGVCLRRAGNSAAAALNIPAAIRQVQGRWNGAETHDQNYLFLHRKQFEGIGAAILRDVPRMPHL